LQTVTKLERSPVLRARIVTWRGWQDPDVKYFLPFPVSLVAIHRKGFRSRRGGVWSLKI